MAVIARMAPQDYHRFHSPVNATISSELTNFRGEDGYTYYTAGAQLVTKEFDVYSSNRRAYYILDSPQFGLIAYIAVGGTCVGAIEWTVAQNDPLIKGQDMGYFQFGGSTVILLFQHNRIRFDSDLLLNSANRLETFVRLGDHIGVAV